MESISANVTEADAALNGPEKAPLAGFPVDTSSTLDGMMSKFARRATAQTVSFRKLVPWIKVGERATHYLHPYPAKLLPQIAHFFLAARQFSPTNAVVLDPFGGTGTVPLEAILAGNIALFSDRNPLARLIATTKTTPVCVATLRDSLRIVRDEYVRGRPPKCKPDVINIDHWYHAQTVRWLSVLRECLDVDLPEAIRNLFLVTFSVTARKASRADSRLSVPVVDKSVGEKALSKPEVWKIFEEQFQSNVRRVTHFNRLLPNGLPCRSSCVGEDARELWDPNPSQDRQRLKSNCVDFIITSPPYGGAQKYIRSSSLSLNWLGLAARDQLIHLERASIGREHFRKHEVSSCPLTEIKRADQLLKKIYKINPSRAVIAGTYLIEMRAALSEMHRVLKYNGKLILVIGNNEVCGLPFQSSDFLREACESLGFTTRLRLVDEIKSRGLMTKRNRAAGIISREWVLVLEKGVR